MFLTVVFTTTATGNNAALATFGGIPAPKYDVYATPSNGDGARNVHLTTDLKLLSGGNGFSGGSWLGCTLVYCS